MSGMCPVVHYNLTRVMNIIGIGPLIAAIRAFVCLISSNRARMSVWIALMASWRSICDEICKTRHNDRPIVPGAICIGVS